MARYDFVCDTCDHTCEEERKISERDDNPPMCQHGEAFHPATHAMRRVTVNRGTSFVLNGKGWYKDHYGLKNTGTEKGS